MNTQSIKDAAEDIKEDFSFLDDWEARYAHIIDLGKALPPLASNEMTDANKVRGCASQVWLVSEPSDVAEQLRYRGASDAILVSGLIALLLQLYSDRNPQDILDFDEETFFKHLGIDDALSPQRSNGFKSMITRIKNDAKRAAV